MDQELISGFPWETIGAGGMFLGLTWLVATGRLVPRSTVDQIMADKDARITYMETESTEQRGTIGNLVAQNAELTASGRLSVALLQSINSSNSSAGSGHVAPSIQE